MNPSPLDCEVLDYLSRRHAVRWSTIPPHWRRRVHTLVDQPDATAWVRRVDVRHVELTDPGRAIAAAYRHGRAALAPGQRELVG